MHWIKPILPWDVCVLPTGADAINEAADAAEKVATEVNQLVAELAEGSQNAGAVEGAYEQRYVMTDVQTPSCAMPVFQFY